ncbi:AraC family transcriptional regulator [Nocardia brevicatena]|uniref:AraC family transcriptional regulator n=1 Tax=Nocardia brevicatena TaxID=37327 RepID=UPI0002E09568|nr:AraC family transcriptional regulator [Nocardia brevicatena]
MDTGAGADRSTPTIWLWQGGAAYLGPSLHLDTHATAVHCFALGVDSSFTLTVAGAESRVRSAVIPARTPHRIRAGTGRMLFFCLDPGSTAPCPDEAALLAHLAGRPDPDTLRRMVLGDTPVEPADPRIVWAMRRIAADPAGSPGATGLAAAVRLSSSRFLHLFTAHSGTSFRRYRLWARMLRVGAALAAGQDLTRAATDAGFASPSHFSDTFHALFGLTASDLLAVGSRIVVAEEYVPPKTPGHTRPWKKSVSVDHRYNR